MTQVFKIISFWFIIRLLAFFFYLKPACRLKENSKHQMSYVSVYKCYRPQTKKKTKLLNQSCCQNKLEYSQANSREWFAYCTFPADSWCVWCTGHLVSVSSALHSQCELTERWLWVAPSKHCFELQAAVHHICMLPCDWRIGDLCDWSTGSLTAVPIKVPVTVCHMYLKMCLDFSVLELVCSFLWCVCLYSDRCCCYPVTQLHNCL